MKRKSVSMFWFRAIATEIVAAGGIMALLGNNHAPPTLPFDAFSTRPMLNRSWLNEPVLEEPALQERGLQDPGFAEQPSFAAATSWTWSPIGSSQATASAHTIAPAPSPASLAWTSSSSPAVSTLSPSAWHGRGAGPRLSPTFDRSRR